MRDVAVTGVQTCALPISRRQTRAAAARKPMANRPAHRSRPVVELRRTIDCLPLATREAMLAGVRAGERIIVGAYVDGRGGVCPMLAAHRRGGGTHLPSLSRAWDPVPRARGQG